MRYNVGDTVIIQQHPLGHCAIGHCINATFITPMPDYVGERATIVAGSPGSSGYDCYSIAIAGHTQSYTWTDCMLAPVATLCIGATIKIITEGEYHYFKKGDICTVTEIKYDGYIEAERIPDGKVQTLRTQDFIVIPKPTTRGGDSVKKTKPFV